MKDLILFVTITCITFAGCSKDNVSGGETPNPPPKPPTEQIKIPINIATGSWTKATDAGFEPGDKVGVFVVNFSGETAGTLATSGNHVTNMGFTFANAWTPDTQIYWKDQTTKADFYCYYPFAASITDITAYPFSVKTNQSAEADYKASDFLWGKSAAISPTSSAVQIGVNHLMSNLIIKLTPGSGYTTTDLQAAVITINNLKTSSTVNLATGIVTPSGTASDISPKAENDFYRALVVPQSISNAQLISVKISGYTYTLTQTIALESNKQHTCTLVVNKTSEGVNITIGGWEKDSRDYGGTVQ